MQEDIEIPQGVRTEVGGEIEYGNEALPQIFWGTVIAMIIVFFFLLFNFKKYGITTVCMAALALMTPGALIGPYRLGVDGSLIRTYLHLRTYHLDGYDHAK